MVHLLQKLIHLFVKIRKYSEFVTVSVYSILFLVLLVEHFLAYKDTVNLANGYEESRTLY